MPNFQKDIKQFPNIHYTVDIPLKSVDREITRFEEEYGLQTNPDFQRGHVWTESQQIAYMEYIIRKPMSGKDLFFNHPGWMTHFRGDFVLVDGLQRLTSIIRFLRDEIPLFGYKLSNWDGFLSNTITVRFHIAKLKTKVDVLQWYLDFNSAGTVHSPKELDKIRQMIANETKLQPGDMVEVIDGFTKGKTGIVIENDSKNPKSNVYKIDYENGFVGWIERKNLKTIK